MSILHGLVVTRVFLDLFESGYFPGTSFYLTMWYRRTVHSFRLAVFLSMATIAGALGGLLTFGIGHMAGVGRLVMNFHLSSIITGI